MATSAVDSVDSVDGGQAAEDAAREAVEEAAEEAARVTKLVEAVTCAIQIFKELERQQMSPSNKVKESISQVNEKIGSFLDVCETWSEKRDTTIQLLKDVVKYLNELEGDINRTDQITSTLSLSATGAGAALALPTLGASLIVGKIVSALSGAVDTFANYSQNEIKKFQHSKVNTSISADKIQTEWLFRAFEDLLACMDTLAHVLCEDLFDETDRCRLKSTHTEDKFIYTIAMIMQEQFEAAAKAGEIEVNHLKYLVKAEKNAIKAGFKIFKAAKNANKLAVNVFLATAKTGANHGTKSVAGKIGGKFLKGALIGVGVAMDVWTLKEATKKLEDKKKCDLAIQIESLIPSLEDERSYFNDMMQAAQ